jgi:Cerato-platanin
MIYFTTFIFTLLLAHIARAVPGCADVASPENMYDPMYDSEQLTLGLTKVTWTAEYGNPNGSTKGVACSEFAPRYPHFHNFPDFPDIGGAFDILGKNSRNCGKCWKLTDTKTHRFIYLLAIDESKPGFGFVLSKQAFTALTGGTVAPPTVVVDYVPVPSHFCDFKS